MDLNLPSDFKFPFLTNKVSAVRIYTVGWDNKILHWKGVIEFRNGDTTGHQEFKGAAFDELVLKMKAFADEMKVNNEPVLK